MLELRSKARQRRREHPDTARFCRLTERDREVIKIVALHGAASRRQLVDLGLFTSTSRANRRLRQLFDNRYLRRTKLATSLYSAETIYILGPNASQLVAEETGLDSIELARQARRQPERMFLEHHLSVLSVRLALRKETEDVRVSMFASEPECRHEYEIVNGLQVIRRLVKPDAFCLIEDDLGVLPCFIELDRGHVSLPQMKGVFGRYDLYQADGAFAAAYEVAEPFQVLVITTAGERRIKHLAALVPEGSIEVKFALYAEVVRQGFFGCLWYDKAGSGPIQLLDRPDERATT